MLEGVAELTLERLNEVTQAWVEIGELGDIFAVKLAPHNRWCGFKALRERWKAYVASSRIRPVLLIDEAQEMSPDVLSELRILSSADFDATSLLTVVLSGDGSVTSKSFNRGTHAPRPKRKRGRDDTPTC